MADFAIATPVKRFFIEMFTRDISLEDAILDLIDNAIDSVIRHKNIDLSNLVISLGENRRDYEADNWVRIQIGDDNFAIEDNCGGIEYDDAKNYVFRFGSDQKPEDSRLSVYGIGLKRAVFKIGRFIEVESKTTKSGFRVTIDVDAWENEPELWQFPLEKIPAADKQENAGTLIKISRINSPASQRIGSGSFQNRIVNAIGESYALFIRRFISVEINGKEVPAQAIPMSNSIDAQASITKKSIGDVKVIIVAGLQNPEDGQWRGNTAGWYIICNGRVVVFADKSELTGWGTRALPTFQPKHRGFIGVALFLSEDPEALPWTTTKRGINAEAPVYQAVRERMAADARQVISILDKRYSSVPISSENTDSLEVHNKALADALKPAHLSQLLADEPRRFSTSKEITKKSRTRSVQYRTKSSNIERAKRAMGEPSLSAGKVGLRALEYFLENEAEE